ncbi:hypothetical protein RN001_002871 [Aquatica leii]|uniref:Uncharacterized protein n=1 Tax=Aquatica leii TaxID=1421715 RepID=A0AAN7PE49_9COLE|nr:hypothetical protein RN001_002871 [Aquatica leii]
MIKMLKQSAIALHRVGRNNSIDSYNIVDNNMIHNYILNQAVQSVLMMELAAEDINYLCNGCAYMFNEDDPHSIAITTFNSKTAWHVNRKYRVTEMEFTSSDSEIISETEYEASEHELDDTEDDSEGDVEIPFVTPIEINLDNNELHQAIPTDMRNQENLEQENTQKAFKRERKRRKHHCIYCYLNVSNYSRHLERNHSDELQVQEIFCLNKKSKKRKKLLDRLRREGDFISTEIVPVLKIENKQTTDYIASKFCKGYYSKNV